MNEFLTEQLVKKRQTTKDLLMKALLIVVTAFIALFTLGSWFGPILLVAIVALDVFLFNRLKVEYEYTYFSGDLDIDKIFNMQSRKRVLSVKVKDIEILAPTGSDALRAYQQLKCLDCSTCEPEHHTYEMVVLHKGQKVRVKFEPNEKILNGMKLLEPRKVIL